jgi:hypothetical protein
MSTDNETVADNFGPGFPSAELIVAREALYRVQQALSTNRRYPRAANFWQMIERALSDIAIIQRSIGKVSQAKVAATDATQPTKNVTSIATIKALKTIAEANYDPMGGDYFVDPSTVDEVNDLLADAPNVLTNYDPMSRYIIDDVPTCNEGEVFCVDHVANVLLALLAQRLALHAEDLIAVEETPKMFGQVITSYAANLFVAAAQQTLKASNVEDAR